MHQGHLTCCVRAIMSGMVAALLVSPAAAQPADLSHLPARPGDTIFVTDTGGVQTAGDLVRLSADAITLRVEGSERTIPASAIVRIEKSDSVWNGLAIGAAAGAFAGAAAAGASCSPHCRSDIPLAMLLYGAVGAGIGALVDHGIQGHSTIFGPPLGPRNARRDPEPVGAVGDLWQRLRQGDAIEVTTGSGRHLKGRFVRVTDTSLTLDVHGVSSDIPSTDVRRVTRRGNRYRAGAIWGGVLMSMVGVASSASCTGGGCGNPAAAGAAGFGVGALWGAAIGATMSKHSTVYMASRSSALVPTPMLGPSRVGLVFSRTF